MLVLDYRGQYSRNEFMEAYGHRDNPFDDSLDAEETNQGQSLVARQEVSVVHIEALGANSFYINSFRTLWFILKPWAPTHST